MNSEYSVVARKYAAAFINVAGDTIDRQEFDRINVLKRFLMQNRQIMFFLNLPIMSKDTINEVLDIMFKDFFKFIV
jgi:F0F1-type ATP synthase delta subunit